MLVLVHRYLTSHSPEWPLGKGLRSEGTKRVRGLRGEAAPSIGQFGFGSDPRDHNFWAAVAIQPLDVGIGSYGRANVRVARHDQRKRC